MRDQGERRKGESMEVAIEAEEVEEGRSWERRGALLFSLTHTCMCGGEKEGEREK